MKISRLWLSLATAAAVSAGMVGTAYRTTGASVLHRRPRFSPATLSSSDAWTVNALDFVSAHQGWVLASNRQGRMALFHTHTGGQQWTLIRTNWRSLGNLNTAWPLTIAFANPQAGWMVVDESSTSGKGLGFLDPSEGYLGVASTTDGGRRWHLDVSGLVFGDGPVSLFTTSASSVWLSTGNVMAGQNGVWHTADGGVQWVHTVLRSPIPSYSSNVSDLDASSANHAVLLTGMQLPHHKVLLLDQSTTDGGRQWHTVRLPATGLPVGTMLPSNSESSAAVRSLDLQWILAAHWVGSWEGPLHLFAYQPRHRRWHLLAIPRAISTMGRPPLLDVASDGVGYLGDNADIWRTSNDGTSWVRLPRLTANDTGG
jgi:hypothetical protein